MKGGASLCWQSSRCSSARRSIVCYALSRSSTARGSGTITPCERELSVSTFRAVGVRRHARPWLMSAAVVGMCYCARSLDAQVVTGTITGVVSDDSLAVLPEVTITVTSPALPGGPVTTVTLVPADVLGQAPTGAVSGTVTDISGSALRGAASSQAGLKRAHFGPLRLTMKGAICSRALRLGPTSCESRAAGSATRTGW